MRNVHTPPPYSPLMLWYFLVQLIVFSSREICSKNIQNIRPHACVAAAVFQNCLISQDTDRQIDRQMNRQIFGQTDRWIDRQIDRHIYGQTDRWIDRQLNRQIDVQTDRWLDRQMVRQIDGQTDRRIDKQTDRQIDRQMDGQIDKKKPEKGLEKLFIQTVWKNKSVQVGTGFIISNFVRSTWKPQDLKRKVS